MSRNFEKAMAVLAEAGVIDSLEAEAQDAREVERAELLERLAGFEAAEAKRLAKIDGARPELEQKVAELEAALEAARRELRELVDGPSSFTGQKLRGKLSKLADPRIDRAIGTLRDLEGEARKAFSYGTVLGQRRLAGGHDKRTVSNAIEVADVMADCRAAIGDLELLKIAKRPDDLAEVLAAHVEPLKVAVRKLSGRK